MAKKTERHITKDPLLYLIKNEAQREGYLKGGTHRKIADDENQKLSISRLAREASVSDTTIRNWFFGTTKRPQGFTSRLVLEALGVTTRWQRKDGSFIKLKNET